MVEFPATGGALTSSHTYSVKLLRYVTYYDYFLASCEIAFCLFIITFIIQEAIKIVKLKKKYFRSAWNCLDLLLLVVSYPVTFTCVLASLGLALDRQPTSQNSPNLCLVRVSHPLFYTEEATQPTMVQHT